MTIGAMASPTVRRKAHPSAVSGSKEPPSSSKRAFNRQCQFCDKVFSKTEHLLRHERSHTKERPFHCVRCNKVYSRHDTLLRHVKSHDPGRPQSRSESMSSSAAVNGMPAGLPLNGYSNLQAVVIGDFQGNDNPAREWHDKSRPLPSLSHKGPANLQAEPLLNPDQFSTTNQSRDAENLYAPPGTHGGASEMPHIQDPFALSISSINEESPLSANNMWGGSLMSPGPSWLVGYDFDLEALNTSVSTTLDISQPLFQSRVGLQDIHPILEDQPGLAAEVERRHKSVADKVRSSWFTQIDCDVGHEDYTHGGTNTRQLTPVNDGNQYDVGDNFRTRITARLKAATCDDPLPSTKFLNLSIQIYFTKFNQIFPAIHGQTFRPSPRNSLLLLSITSIGSLLLGSRAAAAQGTRIFERLNKAILATWEQSLLDPREANSMIQAALIGQTFGLLSGIPKHLAIVEAFHGTIIAWGRRCKLFAHPPEPPDVTTLTGKDLHKAWNTWARSEEIVRTAHGLYIHDAMLSRIFHHAPLLRHDAIRLPPAADDNLFNAPTAAAWKQLMLKQSFPKPALCECLHRNLYNHHASQPTLEELRLKHSVQTASVVINGISALVSEKQQMGQLVPSSTTFAMCFDELICWYFTFAHSDGATNESDTSWPDVLLHIRVLWHTVFMELVTDFDILERAVGKDGPDSPTAEHDLAYARQWANSKEAQRCILHAHSLLYSLGAMRLDAEPAIHIPHCLFLAGIASYSYTKFRRSEHPPFQSNSLETHRMPNTGAALDFPEFSQCGIPIPKHLFESSYASSMPQDSSQNIIGAEGDHYAASNLQDRPRPDPGVVTGIMFTIIDLLQRIGHWGIARKYATTLSTLTKADGDEDWMLI